MTEPRIIYEDNNFLAVNKPAGLLVHRARISNFPACAPSSAVLLRRGTEASADAKALADRSAGRQFPRPPYFATRSGQAISKELTLVEWLLKRYPEIRSVGDEPETRPGIVHRLDRDTSGLLLVAKTQRYFEYLKSLFQKQQIEKKYLAFVFGRLSPKAGVIEKPIGIKSGTIKRSVHSEKMAKAAVTAYKVIKELRAEEAEFFSLLEIRPTTGRTHQIRVHLSSIGHPLVGDKLYGRKKQPIWAARLMLHAYSLGFRAADGRRMQIEVEPPSDFERILGCLRPI